VFLTVLLALGLMISTMTTVQAENTQVEYLAIGDSLAAGINDQGQLGRGYADFFAEALHKNGDLKSYNKGFSYPGYKTTDILKDFKENPSKQIVNLNGFQDEQITIKKAIEEADILTISIGANDVLSYLKLDPSTNQFQFSYSEIMAGIQAMATNYDAILKNIRTINPDIEIFAMGYYNPFPHLVEYETQLSLLVRMLDNTVRSVVTANNGHYVEVAGEIAKDNKSNLPNPNNIHPSEQGYQVVADAFSNVYYATLKPFKDVTLYADIINHMRAKGIIKGYEDGTFRPNEKISRQHAALLINNVVTLTPKVAFKPYNDVTTSHIYYEDIMILQRSGLIKADNQGNFNPGKSLTRGEMALLIANGFNLKATNTHPFSDVSKTSDLGQAISALYEAGITKGYEDGTFKPDEPLSRAHYAVFLNAALNYSK